jgi:Family of unknown function (DUF6352)
MRMNYWNSSGLNQLHRTERAWLQPTDEYLRLFLARPELALVDESCRAERALHAALASAPSRAVPARDMEALQDEDARANYRMFVGFRDALLAAGTLEAYYLRLFQDQAVSIPPLFVDMLVHAMVHNLLGAEPDALEARAAEMLFRAQRVSVQEGQILAGDRETLDMLNETAGLGAMGRLLVQNKVSLTAQNIEVLNDANAARYWATSERRQWLLDLTHEISQDLSHGLVLRLNRARSGLKALARVLEKWVLHFVGVSVTVEPLTQVDDPAWRWHLGLDAEATALLNDLYQGAPVSPQRMARLISLFRLRFDNPQEMRADVAGKPVYLGLAMNAEGVLKIKPQNLLINLPLARPS